MITVLCKVERLIHTNQDTGYTVAALSTEDRDVPTEAISPFSYGGRLQFTATGYYIPSRRGVELEVTGRWKANKKYGHQMTIDAFTEIVPKTTGAIIGYLSSGLIKGIGEQTAKAIVKQFGMEALDIMDTNLDRLLEVPGIGPHKLDSIKKTYQDSRDLREIVAFVSPFGISINKAAKIQNEFKGRAMEILRHSPFKMCTITGFGFTTVDRIAHAMGLPTNDPLRIRCAAQYAMKEAAQNGHLYLPKEALFKHTDAFLNKDECLNPVSDVEIKEQVNHLVQTKELIYAEGSLFIPCYYLAERAIAAAVVDLLRQPAEQIVGIDVLIDNAEAALGILLSGTQREAVAGCLQNNIFILTGGPGTGKTTILKVILHIYDAVFGGSTLLAAPTGRASRKMAEDTGREASTLHSILGLYKRVEEGAWDIDGDPLDANFVIVDECSMADIYVSTALFTRLPQSVKLLLVGDPDQLPPVGGGNVFRDLIQCGAVPMVALDTVFRQQSGSRIAINAQTIRNGETRLLYGNDFTFVAAETEQEAATAIGELFQKLASSYGLEEVQILSLLRSRGLVSVQALNEALRDVVNPPGPEKLELQFDGKVCRLGDKVMQLKNTETASNGDVGFITGITQVPDEEPTLTVTFTGGREVVYDADTVTQLDLALSTTVHKSQGSEYKVVIMPLLKSQYMMLKREILYTGITRARALVVLVGQKQALFTAIRRYDSNQRYTMLSVRVLELCQQKNIGGTPQPALTTSTTGKTASKPA